MTIADYIAFALIIAVCHFQARAIRSFERRLSALENADSDGPARW